MIFEVRALLYVGTAGARTERSVLDADVADLADVYASLRATINMHGQGEGGDGNMNARIILRYKRKTSGLAIADLSIIHVISASTPPSHATPLAIAIRIIYCGIPRQERLCSISFAPYRIYHARATCCSREGRPVEVPWCYRQQVLA